MKGGRGLAPYEPSRSGGCLAQAGPMMIGSCNRIDPSDVCGIEVRRSAGEWITMTKSVVATRGKGCAQAAPSGLRTHEFGFDPFERIRTSLRDPVRLRRASVMFAGALAVAVAGGSWLAFASSDRETAVGSALADRERRLIELDAEIVRRAGRISEMDLRRAALEAEIAETERRSAAVEAKRAGAMRELAELTAPVAPTGDELASVVRPDAEPASEIFAPETSGVAETATTPSRSDSPDDAPQTATSPQSEPAISTGAAAGGQVRVFIHVRSTDRAARERAGAVAQELRRRGVAVAEIRGVMRPVRRDAVRFFYDADRAAVTTLQEAVRHASQPNDAEPQSQDFRSYGAPPRPGTLELWLS